MQDSWFESMVYVEQFSSLLTASMRENLTAFSKLKVPIVVAVASVDILTQLT